MLSPHRLIRHIINQKGMNFMYRLLIAGGDMRYVYLAGLFAAENTDVTVCGFNEDINFPTKVKRAEKLSEAAEQADIIILPLPASHDKVTVNTPLSDECFYLKDICCNASKDAVICYGKADPQMFVQNGIKAVDYASRDDFAILNAVPTCEGGIYEAMGIMDTTIFSSRVLVTGFGRCAKILALTLKAMGAKVSVAARSVRDLSLAQALGFETAHISELIRIADSFDIIFNSIPDIIFTSDILKNISRRCPLIDIASAPGGALKEDATRFGVDHRILPGLPGKYSPLTAAKIIKSTVKNIIRECGKDANQWI